MRFLSHVIARPPRCTGISCIVLRGDVQNGVVLRHGNAKALPLKSVEQLDDALAGEQQEEEQENDSSIANTLLPSMTTSVPASSPNLAAVSSGGGVECTGGVCKLVRKKPVPAVPIPTVNADTTPTAGGMKCTGEVCEFKPAAVPAPARDGKTPPLEKPAIGAIATGKHDGDIAAAVIVEGSLGVGDVMPPLQVRQQDDPTPVR